MSIKNRKPGAGELGPPPTDMELMLYVDGELDAARHREVEAHVSRDARCRAKVAGLDMAAGMVRESALSMGVPGGMADEVMSRIERGEADGLPVEVPPAKSENGAAVRPLSVTGLSRGAEASQKRGVASFESKPANDNSRWIFALAALATAAAAAMMIWGKLEAGPPRATLTPPGPADTGAAPPSAAPEPIAVAAAEGEATPGVEVAAVDFGARMGTIFYVPTGSTNSSLTTTVVWLSDKGTGGE